MEWKPNDKCLAGNRRAIIMKIHQGGRRATLSICNGKDGGEILNWQRESFPIKDLEPYPNPMPAGFWWDEHGFLCFPSLPVPKENDSPNIPSGENQNLENDSPNTLDGENQLPAENDSPNTLDGENQSLEDDSPKSSMLEEKNAPGELLEYAPAGKARVKSKYFAFRYRAAGREKWLHIRGGNVQNPSARENAE